MQWREYCRYRDRVRRTAQLHQRRALAPFAVDEHKGMVRIQAAHTDRPYEGCSVGDRLPGNVERRDNGVDHIHHV